MATHRHDCDLGQHHLSYSKQEKDCCTCQGGETQDIVSGGYVKEPQVGAHDWVTSFDLNSLYPNIIVQYNMSPETVMDGFVEDVSVERYLDGSVNMGDKGYSVAPTGVKFTHDKEGVVPTVIKGTTQSDG